MRINVIGSVIIIMSQSPLMASYLRIYSPSYICMHLLYARFIKYYSVSVHFAT